MKTVTVAAFNSPAEAEPLKTRLVAAGIAAEVHSESKLDEELDFSRVSAGVRIEVPRSDFEAALSIVYAWNVTETAETAKLRQTESDVRGTISRSAGSSPTPPA
ncbi:MAG: hypothetical protein DME23_19050 [Verrucomicrobia bacterium]|nr:MAG: hypothetical protein DME23_19050 [Verrucomicrobiota bacterium]